MRRTARMLATLAALALAAVPASAGTVTGVVRDKAGRPIEFASVSVPATRTGTVTDADGRFTIELPSGPTVLVVSQIGYETARATVAAGATGPLQVRLAEEPVAVDEVVVAASSFGKTGKSEGATLRRMDIMTTPGGAADVFQALRTMPSINAPNEGAALYVRGGDPRETLIRLDGGDIGHPYHFEGSGGGLFSAFDAYMIKSAFFSSGGFSARYGGVLSGVLDVETTDPLNLRTISVGGNMAGGSLSSSWALVPDRLSLIVALRYSDVNLLDRLYAMPSEYVSNPASRDGAAKLLYRYSPTGRLSLLALGSGDRVGVRVFRRNFDGIYDNQARNGFVTLQLKDAIGGRLAVHGRLAAQRYRRDYAYGPMDAREGERNLEASFDAVWQPSPRHEVSFGAIARRYQTDVTGRFPADSTDLYPGAPVRSFDTRPRVDQPGFYAEDKLRLWGPLYATLGGRFDYASVPGMWTADPRGALAWRLDDHQTIRLAAGRYHELADPRLLDPVYGNPELRPLRADHLIAGYEWATPDADLRIEAYRKDYHDLVTDDAATFYANGGHGYARGVDVFARGRRGRASGWISYGWLDSRRMEFDAPREVPASYGVRHSVTLVGLVQPVPEWQVGARFGWTTGRPYTPVIGAFYDPARDLWRPVEGETNSALMPRYARLDLRLLRLFSLPALGSVPSSSVCVFYIEGLNVLGTRNVLEYTWDPTYQVRRATESYFSRMLLVAGFGLTW